LNNIIYREGMMLKVVGIYGSPRKGGNTDLLLDSALKGCQEHGDDIKKVYVRDLHIGGCTGCDGCAKTGMCVIKDDMQDIYTLTDDADVIILSSPIFFYGVTSQVKALIDRGQAMWWRRRGGKDSKKTKKNTTQGRGFLIAVGATRGKNLFECAKLTVRYFFDALGMSFEGGCFFPGIESIGAIKEHPEALQQSYYLCRK
jgi:multimeric flavodoxin WrbA